MPHRHPRVVGDLLQQLALVYDETSLPGADQDPDITTSRFCPLRMYHKAHGAAGKDSEEADVYVWPYTVLTALVIAYWRIMRHAESKQCICKCSLEVII